MCSKQITLLCKFMYDWKISYINKGCEFVTGNFTPMFVLYSDISFYIHISFTIGISAENFKINRVHINYLDFRNFLLHILKAA